MSFDLQPDLHNDLIRLRPLVPDDFEPLYAVASDPLIWEQHPSRNRFERTVFETYFAGALASGGAFCVVDEVGGGLLGSSRFYALDDAGSAVKIGYTFIARSVWGRGYNRALKMLMLDHAFRFVARVLFEVGEHNLRSRRAMEKLGGVPIGEAGVAYHGEPSNPNVIYKIDRAQWAPLRMR